jgi:hypothetical protein
MNSDEKEILLADEADIEAIETISDLSIERINNFTYGENYLEQGFLNCGTRTFTDRRDFFTGTAKI